MLTWQHKNLAEMYLAQRSTTVRLSLNVWYRERGTAVLFMFAKRMQIRRTATKKRTERRTVSAIGELAGESYGKWSCNPDTPGVK